MRARAVVFLAWLALAACSPSEPPRPNVLLITIDTLRADRISALRGERETTPHLDALAAEGLLFTHAQSPRAKTTPAIASLMTGLYPHDHGVRDLAQPLALSFPVLAEKFADAGYATGAIVGNFVLKDAFSGLKRGFDLWVEELPQTQGVPPDDVPQRTARSLTDGALAALGLADATPHDAGPRQAFVEGEKPWFLWLHYMDPHGAYDPPHEHRVFTRAAPDPIPLDTDTPDAAGRRGVVAEYNVPPSARTSDGRIDAALVRDLYDGEVHYVDAQIGRLIDALRARGSLANTLVVVTSDHGESLGEHRYWFEHGRDAYEASCRVPLIVRLPDRFESFADGRARPAPGRRAGDVSLADLAPTLSEVARLSAFDFGEARAPHGVSRAALWHAEDAAPHPVFSEKVDRPDADRVVQIKAVRSGDWKLVQRSAQVVDPNAPGAPASIVVTEEIYDLARDPAEERDLIEDPAALPMLARLRDELARFVAADPHLRELARTLAERRDVLERTDAETLRIIEALGY